MEDIDQHIGHRYVPGHEREHCDWVCEVFGISMGVWETIAMVVGAFLLIGMIFGIRKLIRAMNEERSTPRQRTDAEKVEHIRTIRELRKSR